MKLDEIRFAKIKKSIILILIIGIAVGVFGDFCTNKSYNKYLKVSFSGKLQSFRLGIKGSPYLTIKDNEYFIPFYYTNSNSIEFNSFIQVGDSVVKKEGNGNLYVYRKVGNEYRESVFEIY